MKLIKRHIEKDGSGSITLRPERAEDMWHAYNLIQEGDQVRAQAYRRVISESATGSTSSSRIVTKLTIRVDKVVFSAVPTSTNDESTLIETPTTSNVSTNSDESTTLHISGPVTEESKYVKMGSFHTLDLEIGRDFTILKTPEEGWDSISIDRIREATEATAGAEVGAVVCGDGIANVCLISQHTTIICQRIEVAVPRKRKGGGTALGAEKATEKFHNQIYQAILRHFDFDQLKVIIIASPGFVKEAVLQSIFTEAQRTNNKTILTSRPKFLLVHSSSHHVHALTSVLSSPEVSSQLKDTKFAREGMMLSKFLRMMSVDELRTWYGEDHVAKAVERGAVGTLLISDHLFKSNDFHRRRKFVKLVEDARATGAEVLIFSSMHESGQELNNLTGIAAMLNFPLDIETIEEEEKEAIKENTLTVDIT